MSRTIGIVIIILVLIAGAGYAITKGISLKTGNSSLDYSVRARSLVADFGQKMQLVSLTAATTTRNNAMDEVYAPYVAALLLSEWKMSTERAPGRYTSSPWPDRIEIESVEKDLNGQYVVKGRVIEVTSKEKAEGGIAAAYPVTVTVGIEGETLKIMQFERGEYLEDPV